MNGQRTVVIAIPMLLGGGTEIQTLALANVLLEEKYRVVLCCYYEYDGEIVKEFEKRGVEVDLMRLRRPDTAGSAVEMVTLVLRLRNYFRKTIPDVVHVQYVAPGLVPILAAKLAGVMKVFATIHYPRYLFGAREKRFVRIGAELCTMFFCNSLATERSWFGSGTIYDSTNDKLNSRHCTIYNSIDIHRIETLVGSVERNVARETLGITHKHTVGVVARLRFEKGHSFLLHAMKQVVQSMPGTILLVVGDGPDKSALKALSKELEIDNSVVWLGAKAHEETLRLYRLMDVVVVPSKFEGFGLSAAEAMAAGVPVVASDVDGLREVVDDGNSGMLVPFGNVEKMVSALRVLLSNPEKASSMGKSGKLRVEQLFSLARFRNAIMAAYSQF